MNLDDKSAIVVSQYEINVTGYYRERGGGYLETPEGLLLLRSRDAKEGRVFWEEEVKCCTIANGYHDVDVGVRNKEGNYVTEGDYSETYIVRHWRKGEEIDLRNPEHARHAATALGNLHRAMQGVPLREEYVLDHTTILFERRIREMRRLSTYLRKRKQKVGFERELEEHLPKYIRKAEHALALLVKADITELHKRCIERRTVCHGNYGSHALVYIPGGTIFVSNFEHAGIGPQMEDLYYLLRKTLEKNEWNNDIYEQIMACYEKERPLERDEVCLLLCLLLFPEKFYRVCNQYLNTRKAWIPVKNAQKLEFVLEQQATRDVFETQVCLRFAQCCEQETIT